MTEAVSATEEGVVRLYAVDVPVHQIKAFSRPDETGNWALADALGVASLNPRYAQVIYIADLEGVGLAEYLAEGEGLSDEDLAPYLPSLERLTGHVAVISSRAFDGAVTLDPKPPLTPILTLRREKPTPVTERLSSDAAKGVVGAKGKPTSDAAISGRVASIVLLLLALFVVLFVWVAS